MSRFVPTWAITGRDPDNPNLFVFDIDAYAKYIEAFVHTQEGNACDFSNGEEIPITPFYVDVQKAFYKAVKLVNPEYRVGTYKESVSFASLKWWQDNDMLDSFDYVDSHYYGGMEFDIQEIRRSRQS